MQAAIVRDRGTGQERSLLAPYFLDASELGDLLPLAGVEFVTGAESQAKTGEPHAPSESQPANQQAITCCFAADYLDGQDHTIDRPAEYDFWRGYVPALKPSWPGRLLDLTYSDPDHAEASQPRIRPARPGAWALGLSPNPRPAQLSAWLVSWQLGNNAGQLAAE